MALGLIFLRYISTTFRRKHDELIAEYVEAAAKDHDEYLAQGIFGVPDVAR